MLDKARHAEFQAAQVNRPNLVLVGAKDGMIHAVRSNPTAMTVAPSGSEAWAYVPSKIASGMLADYTASLAGTTVVTSFPDGSPTLADFRRANGTFGTMALVSSGNGGQSLIALDVTSTIDPSSGAVLGPTPLWEVIPGGADAGQGRAKPVLLRTRIAGADRWLVVAATGLSPDNPAAPWTKGRIVSAYDAPTGALMWRFKAACPVTSDLVAFETSDPAEPGTPEVDGFMDRVMFADACGYVYKLDPSKSLGNGWNDNSGLGTYEVEAPASGTKHYAVFSTERTPGALGKQSPIAGTLGATNDVTDRMTVFFGTGGLESHPTNARNEFYAIYASDGSIRSTEKGDCVGGRCEKFYGGVLVTAEQVVFTRTIDPAIGTGTCDLGSTIIQGMALSTATTGAFEEAFQRNVGAAVMGALYGDAGALYFANLSGESVRVGTPRVASAGGDSAAPGGIPQMPTTPNVPGTTSALNLLGWRQVF